MEVVRLKAKDYEEATDFLDLVFSKTYEPTDFRKMLPICYQPADRQMSCNFAVRDGGRLRAIVGLFPTQVHVGDAVLTLGGIGGVSSHPNDRGKGWMKILMARCIQEMENEKIDLSFLTGLRQRYQFFGYEKAGTLLEYEINQINVRRFRPNSREDAAFLFRPLCATDVFYIKKAKALYDQQEVRNIRPLSDFKLYLLSMNGCPWIALRPDGEMAGYFVVGGKQERITEIFAQSEDVLIEMLCSWFARQKTETIQVLLAPWQESVARRLGVFAEAFRITDNGNWRIFNWENVISGFLKVKSAGERLCEGSLCIGIEGYGTVSLHVSGGKAACVKTSAPPDFQWDALSATRIILGHMPTRYVTGIPDSKRALVESWFPLPLGWPLQNYV